MAKREYESKDVADAAARMINGLVKRAAAGDTEALVELAKLQGHLAAAVNEAGARAHLFGYSYTTIAGELGIARQAARQRFQAIVERIRTDERKTA
jgi:DNA-directed RNA polymerase specialized sigma24 family protein